MDLSIFLQPAALISLAGLIALELVLAVDNLIFITIVTNRLPEAQQPSARRWGLTLAVVTRLMLLFSAAWMIQLTAPWFTIFGEEISGRDLILIVGGLFLIWKATMEIHERVTPAAADELEEPEKKSAQKPKRAPRYWPTIGQIMILDIVFSLDSVITAIGLTRHLEIMVVAVLVSVIIMIIAAEPLARFVNRNPNVVMLALAFLVMIGMTLVGEGFDFDIPKVIIYSAMAFSVTVEALNMLSRRAKLSSTFRDIRKPDEAGGN
ncbi:TerC family protein [Ferrovibrio sp.]|uniref:TerC family protein n=1 Tax=Ferrovibrio sp. TaxID=1917215 RepID=UPI0025B7C92A|nr:TerC family protein [Ferrovibrio sp.]MBX3455715.1 TerC family protein [Ferrovibrio sp.]